MAKLHEMEDDAVIEALTEVKGIGVWTAQMFLMFRLGRPDILPVLDLGIRNAIRRAYRLRKEPDGQAHARAREAVGAVPLRRLVVSLAESRAPAARACEVEWPLSLARAFRAARPARRALQAGAARRALRSVRDLRAGARRRARGGDARARTRGGETRHWRRRVLRRIERRSFARISGCAPPRASIARVGDFHARLFDELERHARKLAWSPLHRQRTAGAPARIHRQVAPVSHGRGGAAHRRGDGAVDRRRADGDERRRGRRRSGRHATRDRPPLSRSMHGEHRQLGRAAAPPRLPAAPWPRLRCARRSARRCCSRADGIARTPLLDPLCGAGTIPIEGALIARRIPPGLSRSFAFMRVAGLPRADVEESARRGARADARRRCRAPILGSDRDAGAIAAVARECGSARAWRGTSCSRRRSSRASRRRRDAPPGAIVTNPPYGVRVGDRDALRNLYAQLGTWRASDSRVGDSPCSPPTRGSTARSAARWRPVLATKNGGIAVRAMRSTI